MNPFQLNISSINLKNCIYILVLNILNIHPVVLFVQIPRPSKIYFYGEETLYSLYINQSFKK